MVEWIGSVLVGAALSIVLIPIAIVLTTIVLLVFSLPFRLFKATRDPHVAVGIPALGCAIWTLWYGEVGFFRVALQYGFASMLAGALWEMRDNSKERKRQQAIERDVDRQIPRPAQAPPAATAQLPVPGRTAEPASPAGILPIAQRSASEIVKETLAEVDKAEGQLGDLIGLPLELLTEVRQQIADASRTVHSVRVDGVSPRNIAWLVVSNVAGEMVACGHYHVYRGLLSMSGKALQQAFHRATDELQKAGFHDAAGAAKDREWLRERIKEVG
jgi:hypothetical protein